MFSNNLKEQRIKTGLTQDELASKINVSRSAIAKWEQGRGVPNKSSIDDLCRLFGVTENDLIYDYSAEVNKYLKKQRIGKGILIGISSLAVAGIVVWISFSVNKSLQPKYTPSQTKPFNFSLGDSLIKVGDSYTVTMEDCSFNETGVTIDRVNASVYSDGSYYTVAGNTVTFSKPGKYSIYGVGFDDKNKIEYDVELRTVYCYDEKDVVLINSVSDLDKMRNDPAGVFSLNANLDLRGVSDYQPIGIKAGFSGIFMNPHGYWIYGLSIPSSQSGMLSNGLACFSGLFSWVENAYFSGIIMKNEWLDISDYSGQNGTSFVGGITGGSGYSCLNDCHVYGTIRGVSYIGGIAGDSGFDDVRGCSFDGMVSSVLPSSPTGFEYGFGGIVGHGKLCNGTFEGFIENCQANGTVTGPNCVGGIVGMMEATDSYADHFKNNSFTGSIVCSGNDKGVLFGSYEDW